MCSESKNKREEKKKSFHTTSSINPIRNPASNRIQGAAGTEVEHEEKEKRQRREIMAVQFDIPSYK